MLPVKEERHLIKILRSNIREKRRRRRQKNIQFSVVLCVGKRGDGLTDLSWMESGNFRGTKAAAAEFSYFLQRVFSIRIRVGNGKMFVPLSP